MTNDEARGYAMLAASAIGLKSHDLVRLYDVLPSIFDVYTESEAERKGDRIYLNAKELARRLP